MRLGSSIFYLIKLDNRFFFGGGGGSGGRGGVATKLHKGCYGVARLLYYASST